MTLNELRDSVSASLEEGLLEPEEADGMLRQIDRQIRAGRVPDMQRRRAPFNLPLPSPAEVFFEGCSMLGRVFTAAYGEPERAYPPRKVRPVSRQGIAERKRRR